MLHLCLISKALLNESVVNAKIISRRFGISTDTIVKTSNAIKFKSLDLHIKQWFK